jgi:hypothetical protein
MVMRSTFMSGKMRYGAGLQGAEIDLKLLAHCFSTDECRVSVLTVREAAPTAFYMLSSPGMLELEPCSERALAARLDGTGEPIEIDVTWDKAFEVAESLLSVMHGAARLVRDDYRPVSIGAMLKFTLDGSFVASWSRGSYLRDYSFPPDRTLTDLVRLWAFKGLEDQAVSLALTIYGTQPLGWATLYMVYEVIKDDVGIDGIDRLVGIKAREAFKKAANNARRPKDGPRHAYRTEVDEEKLISYETGNGVVRHLLNHWLGEKVGMIMA